MWTSAVCQEKALWQSCKIGGVTKANRTAFSSIFKRKGSAKELNLVSLPRSL